VRETRNLNYLEWSAMSLLSRCCFSVMKRLCADVIVTCNFL